MFSRMFSRESRVFSRETRVFSRETRVFSCETCVFSRETRVFSRKNLRELRMRKFMRVRTQVDTARLPTYNTRLKKTFFYSSEK